MTEIVFQGWPKTPRLFRDSIITEKIDGTNAAIGIGIDAEVDTSKCALVGGTPFAIYAQSRNRLITPETDNYRFADWVWENRDTLAVDLGPGLHFGEWWGLGIQRGYGLDHKRFSLFNTAKWSDTVFTTPNLDTVPVLSRGNMNTEAVTVCLDWLARTGSMAAPEFKPAEGVCIYHTASRQVFKALIDNDHLPKSVPA